MAIAIALRIIVCASSSRKRYAFVARENRRTLFRILL